MASTYGSGLRARLDQASERGFGVPAYQPSDDAAEAEYQRKLLGGYDKRNIRCEVCFEYKSLTGECQCW